MRELKARKVLCSVTSVVIALVMMSTCIMTASAATSKVDELDSMFTTADLMDATITELLDAMDSGKVTSEELVQMYIDRIEAYDEALDLNSIIMVNPNALEEAKKIDAERESGEATGKLSGIPIIVKDNYDVEGLPTSAGAAALAESIAPDDAYVVSKLEEEGAIILAKANLSEFAWSGSNSRSSLGGTVHNAFDPARTAAGSSGGTAVSVTSNFAAAGLGTDTGSSIRRPSSFSNLYGLRPSTGLTSRDGVVPLNLDRDVTGPMCRTVEDLALILEVIAGTDENDEWTSEADSYIPEDGCTSYLNEDGLEGKTIGYLMNSFGYYYDRNDELVENAVELDSKIVDMVDTAKQTLESGGATLVDISDLLPDSLITSLRSTAYVDVFEWNLNVYLSSIGEDAPCKTMADIINTGYGVGYITDLGEATATSLSEMSDPRETETYAEMVAGMLNFRTTVSDILTENGIDAVVFVSQTDVADIEETSNNHNNNASYLNYFGPVAGLPEMMIPMGFSEADPENGYDYEMPLGMSMFTSYGNEETLIEMAYAYEQLSDVRQQPWTTPALEDDELTAFVTELLDEIGALDSSSYTEASRSAVSAEVSAISDISSSDVEAYQEEAYKLAEAYDSLELSDEQSTDAAPVYGDVNGDGEINVIDVTLVQKASVNLEKLSDEQTILADVNDDGRVSVLDATCIQKAVVGGYTDIGLTGQAAA
ncbi:MAG: dockerin type I domain-containing protein [Clostridiales bacterium]|nr:dockerin type I domain-containing protein [Clostridiales bacterium]